MKQFLTFQSDGYWVDGKSNRKVKLPEVNFHELCQRELDALASIAIDRINKNPAIPDVKIKYKKTGMAKIARKLSALSHPNQQEQEFVSLFGIEKFEKKGIFQKIRILRGFHEFKYKHKPAFPNLFLMN